LRDVKQFFDLCKAAAPAGGLTVVQKVNKKSNQKKGLKSRDHVKFKVRTKRQLYTYICDASKLDKIRANLPPSIVPTVIKRQKRAKPTSKKE